MDGRKQALGKRMPGPRWKREPRLDDVSVVTTPNPGDSSAKFFSATESAAERDLSAETRRKEPTRAGTEGMNAVHKFGGAAGGLNVYGDGATHE